MKYLRNFWRTCETPLIICEINLNLNWSKKCVIVASSVNQQSTFSITDAKLHVSVLTLSTKDNAKLLEQLKSGLKKNKTRNWNKYQSKKLTQRQNQYLYYLIDPSFQGVNIFFYHLKMKHNEQVTNYFIFQL